MPKMPKIKKKIISFDFVLALLFLELLLQGIFIHEKFLKNCNILLFLILLFFLYFFYFLVPLFTSFTNHDSLTLEVFFEQIYPLFNDKEIYDNT